MSGSCGGGGRGTRVVGRRAEDGPGGILWTLRCVRRMACSTLDLVPGNRRTSYETVDIIFGYSCRLGGTSLRVSHKRRRQNTMVKLCCKRKHEGLPNGVIMPICRDRC